MQGIDLQQKNYSSVGEMVYQTILPNGLRVFLLPKEEFNETYGILTTRFGAIDTQFTPYGEQNVRYFPAGIAHFLEHKLFENEYGEDLMQHFVRFGAESNAFTGYTKTSYLFSTTMNVSQNVALLQELVSHASFTEESVQREKSIIQQEIDMYQDDPDFRLFSQILANLYPQTPLAEDIAGTRQSILEVSKEALEINFETFYHPSNMSLLLVGQFNAEEILSEIIQKQGQYTVKKREGRIERFPLTNHQIVETGQHIRMEVAHPKLAIGLRGRDNVTPSEMYRYKIMLKLLFSMMFGWTSKRFQRLYETGKIDHSLTLEVEVEEAFHFVVLTMDTSEPVSLSHQFRSAIRRFEKDPDITEEHLDIIKSELFGDFLHGLNSLEYIATHYETFIEGDNFFDLPKILQDITIVDLLEVGRQFIHHCEMTDFTIFPK